MPRSDVIIIGAGISGCATAAHLLRLNPGLKVTLLDRHHVGAGSTSRSMAGFRHQWSLPVHVAFSRYAAAEYDALAEQGSPLAFRRDGYLFLYTDRGALDAAAKRARQQLRMGVPGLEVLAPDQIPARTPCGDFLRLETLSGAVWGPHDGFLDPLAAAQAYLEEARRGGALYRPGTPVRAIERAPGSGRATGVMLEDGTRLVSERIVLTAGVWSIPLAGGQGLPLPLRPAKRYLYHSRPLTLPRVEGWPLVVGPRGAHFRPAEGNTLQLAWERRPDPLEGEISEGMLWEGQDTIDPGFGTDPYGYGIDILGELAPLAPLMAEQLALASVTCGWYQVTADHKAILSEEPRLPGLFVAVGFSGHGIMHAPATGRTLAELVLGHPTGLAAREEIERHFGLSTLLEGGRREPVEQMGL